MNESSVLSRVRSPFVLAGISLAGVLLVSENIWARRRAAHTTVPAPTNTLTPGTFRRFTSLYTAMSERRMHDIRGLLPTAEQINDVDRASGSTPLLWAMLDATPQTLFAVNLVLSRGAKWNAPGMHGELPLHHAVDHGYVEIVRLALQGGANVKQLDGTGTSPMENVCENGVSNAGRDDDWAPQFGRWESAQLLMAAGADVNQPWATGAGEVLPLDRCEVNHQELVKSLLVTHGARFSLMVRLNRAPQVTNSAPAAVIPATVLAPVDPTRTRHTWAALYEAISAGTLATIQPLLPANAEMNDVDAWSLTTPLAWTAGLSSLDSAKKIAVFELLVAHGADVNAKGIVGESALMEAARTHWLVGVNWLIAHGAHATDVNRYGFTALHQLCWNVGMGELEGPQATTQPRIEVARALITAGASNTAEAVQGPLHIRPSATCEHDYTMAPVKDFLAH